MCRSAKVKSAKCHKLSNLPKYIPHHNFWPYSNNVKGSVCSLMKIACSMWQARPCMNAGLILASELRSCFLARDSASTAQLVDCSLWLHVRCFCIDFLHSFQCPTKVAVACCIRLNKNRRPAPSLLTCRVMVSSSLSYQRKALTVMKGHCRKLCMCMHVCVCVCGMWSVM